MSENPKLQIGGTVNGDLIIVRADSADELKELTKGLADVADEVITDWSSFKQAALAKGVFTADSGKSSGGGGKAAASDSAPPSGDTPTCQHGPMKDLAGRGYKNRWYCKEYKKENQCPARP